VLIHSTVAVCASTSCSARRLSADVRAWIRALQHGGPRSHPRNRVLPTDERDVPDLCPCRTELLQGAGGHEADPVGGGGGLERHPPLEDVDHTILARADEACALRSALGRRFGQRAEAEDVPGESGVDGGFRVEDRADLTRAR
jgi:hypothetical protein